MYSFFAFFWNELEWIDVIYTWLASYCASIDFLQNVLSAKNCTVFNAVGKWQGAPWLQKPSGSTVLLGIGGANAPLPGSSDVGPILEMGSLIRLRLLSKQLYKLETIIQICFFATVALSCKALRKDFFKWYLHCQDC